MTNDVLKLKALTLNVRGLRSKVKRTSVYNWLKKQKVDVVFLQETYFTKDLVKNIDRDWTGKSYHAFTDSVHSRGVSILLNPKLTVSIINTHISMDGRKLMLNANIDGTQVTLVNVYAPNDCNNRIDFFKVLGKWIKQKSLTDENIIVGGDFNSIDNSCDRLSNKIERCSKHFTYLKKFVEICDLWRKIHPTTVEYTYVDSSNRNYMSRIDYIMASEMLSNNVKIICTKVAPVPDHKAVIVVFEANECIRGKGYWKINNSVLKDDSYKKSIIEIFKQTINEYKDIATKRNMWDLCKIRFKEFSIKYCIEKKRGTVNLLKGLEDEINQLDNCILQQRNNVTLIENRKILKQKYDALNIGISKGAQIRSRAHWFEEAERSTSFFLRLEQKRQINNKISGLKSEDGTMATGDAEVLKVAGKFYEKLFSSNNVEKAKIEDYLNTTDITTQLNEEDALQCEGLLSISECAHAVKNLKKNKAPGLDGLTNEFYQTFWSDFGEFLVDVFNEAYHEQKLSFSQNQSVLSLIFKKGEKCDIANYRPISLTNVDYKLIAFCLANRMHKILPTIISSDQTGYMKKRFIGQNIRLVQDIIEHADKHNTDGALLFLDFQKAFDSVEWEFIFSTLEHFKFPPSFIQWVKTLYNKPQFIIKNNGYLSQEYYMHRGVRQGCPLSALLFILVVEVLAVRMKQSRDIDGYTVNVGNQSKTFLISQYADDCTIMLKNLEQVPSVIELLDSFGQVAGTKLNVLKTVGKLLGRSKNLEAIFYGINFTNKPVKCLGVFVGHNLNKLNSLNWDKNLLKLERTVETWKSRDLTLFGKITIIKTLALSKLLFVAQNCNIPENMIKEINKMIYLFLWGKGIELNARYFVKI